MVNGNNESALIDSQSHHRETKNKEMVNILIVYYQVNRSLACRLMCLISSTDKV